MEESTITGNLFTGFPSSTKDDWARAATKEVEGKNPMELLSWTFETLDGHPYYDHSDAVTPDKQIKFWSKPRMTRGWINLPIINVLEESTANAEAHDHLINGADGVLFDCRNADQLSFQKLLIGIEWNHCTVSFVLPERTETLIESLLDYVKQKAYVPSSLHGFFMMGTYPHHSQDLHKVVHSLIPFENLCSIGIHTQTARPVELVSDLLTQAVNAVDAFTKENHDASSLLRKVFFAVDTGTDFFVEVAKLKALRWLWFQVVRAYGVTDFDPSDLHIHALSTAWKQTAYEPHENMLKGTTASIAAILGGCDTLTVQPDDAQDTRQRRIARNVSNLLREESHLSRVTDATAGSYYVDALVQDLASKAWDDFKRKIAQR